jgi:hypothetical protein
MMKISTMNGVHVDPLKQLLQKGKDTWSIEHELAKDIETLPKVPGFSCIGLEYASRI